MENDDRIGNQVWKNCRERCEAKKAKRLSLKQTTVRWYNDTSSQCSPFNDHDSLQLSSTAALNKICLFATCLSPCFEKLLTQARYTGYSLLSSISLACNIFCECQILQALFHHYVAQKFQLSPSDCKQKCPFLFSLKCRC